MLIKQMRKRGAAAVVAALIGQPIVTVLADGPDKAGKTTDAAAAFATASPIKHVIILIGENRGFDHTFGVYKPKGKGQTISNILSTGIVNQNGMPGPNFA